MPPDQPATERPPLVSPGPGALAGALFESALDCIIVADTDGRIVEFNPAAERVFGWSRAEIIGLTMEETFIPPVHRHAHRTGMVRYLAGRQARVIGKRLHLTALRRDGREFPVELTIAEVHVDQRPFFVAHMRDIEAETLARRELEDSKALFEAFIQNAPNPMALMDPTGRQVMVNHAAARYYDQTPEALVAAGPDVINAPVLQTGITAMLGRIASSLQPEQTFTRFRMPSGEIRELAFSFFPVIGAGDKLTYIGNITFDMTEERQAKARLQTLQSQLLALFNHAPANMYVKDVAGPVIFCSPGMAKSVSRTPEDMVGMTEDQFLGPELLAAVRRVDARIIATKKPVNGEMLNPLTGRYEFGSRFPILDEAGEVAQIGGMIIDIDERVRAQQALDETRARLQAFMDNSPIAMSLGDNQGRLVMINKAGAAYFGRTPAEVLALPPEATLASWVEMDSVIRPLSQKIAETKSTEIIETLLHSAADQTVHRILLTMFPVLDRDGEVALIGGASVDITAMREAQDALARSKEALHQSEKLAALGQLLAGVAHELNNPLSVVRGRSELLEEQLAGTPYATSLRKLTEAADRCARIVKAFLAMARQTGPQRVMGHVNDLVDIATDLASHGLRSAGITLDMQLSDTIPEIEMDDDQIVQVLINLVVNAQQALEEVPAPRRLTIRTGHDPVAGTVSIEVADNGPGIPAALAARVFDPFFTTKAVGKGTGLGLSVCKGIVEGHDGRFTLLETPGGGATFRVVLPVRTAATLSPEPAASPAPAPSRGRILIVDDEPEVAAILAECLSPLGFDCTVADGGEAALALIGAGSFDAVFSDVRMPGMDGLALFDRIAAGWPALASRFVFISGDVLHRDVMALAAKGRPVIEKPFNAGAVRDAALAIVAQGTEA